MSLLESMKQTIAGNKPVHIAYYGPSTTSFEYVFPNWGEIIRYVLKNHLESSFEYNQLYWNLFTHNLGLDGAKSSEMLARFDELVLGTKPHTLILHAGINDYYFNVPLEESEKNISALIDKALAAGIAVIYWTTVPTAKSERNAACEAYCDVERKIAGRFAGNPLFAFVDAFALFPKDAISKSYTLIEEFENPVLGLKPGDIDYDHFNRYGNAVLAGLILSQAFGISFDHEQFLADSADPSKKYPRY